MSRRRRRTGKVGRTTARYGHRAVDSATEEAAPASRLDSAIDEVHPERWQHDASAAPVSTDSQTASREWAEIDPPSVGLIARYFKLTLAMVFLNVVVAGANVAMLFRRSAEPRTIVVTQPAPAVVAPPVAPAAAAPAPAPTPSLTEAPAVAVSPLGIGRPVGKTTAAAAPVARDRRVPLLGKVPKAKVPLLGTPTVPPRAKVTSIVEASRSPRVVATLRSPKSPITAREEQPGDLIEDTQATERW